MENPRHHLHTEKDFFWGGDNGLLRTRPTTVLTPGASSTVYSRIITYMLVLMRGTITPTQHWFNTLQLLTLLLVIIQIYISRMSVGSDLV